VKSLKKKIQRKTPPERAARMVEAIFGCKWSLTVFHLLANDVNRPGAMVRSVEGLTTKVLNDCLRKNLEFGIIEKKVFKELPLRVEYFVTPFGEKFLLVLDQVEELQLELDQQL